MGLQHPDHQFKSDCRLSLKVLQTEKYKGLRLFLFGSMSSVGYDSLNHAPLLDIELFLCWVSNIAVFGHDK